MKLVFFGSDDFAVANLEALVHSKHKVLACVTQPDKKKGRHLELGISPVKEFALKNKIAVLQPSVLKDSNLIQSLKDYNADIFVVIAYGKFLPEEILSLPKTFCINVHASLLPKYRGAAPINWAVINGETTTGISVIKVNESMDAGDIIGQKEVKIEPEDTSITLRLKIATAAAPFLLETLEKIESKTYTLTKQSENAVTLAPKLTKSHGLIDWQKSAVEIHNLVRGLLPWPAAFTKFNKEILKILDAKPFDEDPGKFSAGDVVGISKNGIAVATGKGVLQIYKVHLEASKPMDAKSFVAGHKIGIGFKFQQ